MELHDSNQHRGPQDSPKALRMEIIETQKARSDLLKYKLIGVAVLAATGLGLQQSTPQAFMDVNYTLGIIPFVCVYVDLLCYHFNIRILVIGNYLRCHDDKYEVFVHSLTDKINALRTNEHRRTLNIFEIEDWALLWSSIALSLLVLIYAIYLMISQQSYLSTKPFVLLFLSISGIVLSAIIRRMYDSRSGELGRIADLCVQTTDH